MSTIVTRSQEIDPVTPLGADGSSLHSLVKGRACDRCRRRKVKCLLPENGRCTQCRDGRVACTFNLPAGKRGPKVKQRVHGNAQLEESSSPGTLDLYMDEATSIRSADVPADEAVSLLESIRQHRHIPRDDGPGVDASDTSTLQPWHQLLDEVTALGLDLHLILNQCIDLFFQYLYPLTPLLHEASFRDSLNYFIHVPLHHSHQYHNPPLPTSSNAAFTLISAVCAEAAFLLPKDIFPHGEKVADIFLQASRSCLNSYLEADLEHPTASSITIRYFHSNCVHAAGKPKYSWHIFGEATRLAQAMRLHDESTYQHLDPIEAELRRRVFWIVYMGDKSAAILNDRPITMHKYSFESGITAAYPTGIEDEYYRLPVSPNGPAVSTEAPHQNTSIIVGFNANIRVWQVASDLLLAIRIIREQRRNVRDIAADENCPAFSLTEAERYSLDPLYVSFITCLDDLPPFLRPGSIASSAGDEARSKSNQFLVQCANLQVSLQCLRMVMTHKFEELSYLTSGSQQADLQKTEIVREMVQFIRQVPFWALQVNGEPYVEKIRLVGVSLMEIIHRNSNSMITARARDDFGVLLDILARLDSKASDALRNTSTSIL